MPQSKLRFRAESAVILAASGIESSVESTCSDGNVFMSFNVDLDKMGADAVNASHALAVASEAAKNEALLNIVNLLEKMKKFILEVNAKEVKEAISRDLPAPMIDRMNLTEERFQEMVNGVRHVATLPDPVGRILEGHTVSSGLQIVKRTVPLGVIGVIYESRPNVTVDIAALCIKSGNACILRGGSECFKTNLTLAECMQEALDTTTLPSSCVNFISSTDRELVNKLLTSNEFVDVIIPRGGEALHRSCVEHASVPVIVGGFGVSHIYVDESAILERAVPIIINAKIQKPSACNALDTLIVHRDCVMPLMEELLPKLEDNKIVLHVHGELAEVLQGYPFMVNSKDGDLDTEFLGMHLNIVLVDSISDAILHIRKHKGIHSDSIITESMANADMFTRSVPSACVYVNASTRFTDGGQFGMGAEVAVSTQKLHVRGPMGLEALTTYQYVCHGDYLCRE